VKWVELVAAGLLAIAGVRSLVRWLRTEFHPASPAERLLYALHVTARVGMWFAFAGFAAGYALVDDPGNLTGFVMVPIALAALQLLTGFFLSRPGARAPR
jgi:hypothetical protein